MINGKYPFGLLKIESIAGLFNGIFLVFAAANLLVKSVGRIYYFKPGTIKEEYDTEMVLVSTGGLVINLIGLCFFHEDEEDHNENTYGLFLHVLADTLGSLGVLASCFMIKQYDMEIFDPICALTVSIMIFISVLPLIKISCESLLITSPV